MAFANLKNDFIHNSDFVYLNQIRFMHSYQIIRSESELDLIGDYICKHNFSNIFILTDPNTRRYCWPVLRTRLPCKTRLIASNITEQTKNLSSVQYIWDTLFEHRADRKSVLVNLGGGVISDVGGFAASTFKRGISYINIPTSLLAMVDASIGGKTGINYFGGKNQIGTFHPPERLFVYPGFLQTLPRKELLSGLAEMLKHGLIYDEAYFYETKDYTNRNISELIEKSIRIKFTIVNQDKKEEGVRQILNFGHTVGHALESFFQQYSGSSVTHGHAIGMGMVAEAFLSRKFAGLDADSFRIIRETFQQLYDFSVLDLVDTGKVLQLMRLDKKNVSGEIRFVLLEQIGKAVYNKKLPLHEVEEALLVLKNLNNY